jgi:hypothetical protein
VQWQYVLQSVVCVLGAVRCVTAVTCHTAPGTHSTGDFEEDSVFWNVLQCSLIGRGRFRVICCFHVQVVRLLMIAYSGMTVFTRLY